MILPNNRRWWLIAATGGVASAVAFFVGLASIVEERASTFSDPSQPPLIAMRSAPAGALTPQPAAVPAPTIAAVEPAFELAATTAAGTRDAAALVRSRFDLQEAWVREGESAAPGVLLVEVGSERAVFSSGAAQFTLWAHANATPAFATEFDDGRVVGARVLAAPAGGVVAALGLRSGDVILAINGLPVPSRPHDLAQALRGAPSLMLQLRGGDGEVHEVQLTTNPAYGKQF